MGNARSHHPHVEIVADYRCEIGENPIWNPIERRIYWCDIPSGRIFRYDPSARSHEQCYQGDIVGGFTVQIDGSLLLFMEHGSVRVWRDGKLTTVLEEIREERSSRFNDVIADPEGRVFCGTMSTDERAGRLYRLDPDGSITLLFDGIGCSNGMAFSPDRRQMYHTDSFARQVYLFDYDQESGALSNKRVFSQLPEEEGMPDGATLDANGCLWSAIWDGGKLIRYLSNGQRERQIAIPARKVSSVTFGGDRYSDLYVTTAGGNCKESNGPAAGALLRLSLGIHGVAEFLSRIGL